MGVTKIYVDALDEWVIYPAMRYVGGGWVYDQQAKVYDPVAHAWVPMNGVDPCVAAGGLQLEDFRSLYTEDGDCILVES